VAGLGRWAPVGWVRPWPACRSGDPYPEVCSSQFDLGVEPCCPGVAEFDTRAVSAWPDRSSVELGDIRVTPQPSPRSHALVGVWFSGRLASGPAVRATGRRHWLRLAVVTLTRSAYVQLRCAVVALWRRTPTGSEVDGDGSSVAAAPPRRPVTETIEGSRRRGVMGCPPSARDPAAASTRCPAAARWLASAAGRTHPIGTHTAGRRVPVHAGAPPDRPDRDQADRRGRCHSSDAVLAPSAAHRTDSVPSEVRGCRRGGDG
jgi:hypothetical protein